MIVRMMRTTTEALVKMLLMRLLLQKMVMKNNMKRMMIITAKEYIHTTLCLFVLPDNSNNNPYALQVFTLVCHSLFEVFEVLLSLTHSICVIK